MDMALQTKKQQNTMLNTRSLFAKTDWLGPIGEDQVTYTSPIRFHISFDIYCDVMKN